jgi:2,3-bisphosphoglycerate-dependent phosphoglycerate mutase
MHLEHIPLEQSWRLNERHYGALQGMGSLRAICRYGPLPVLRCKYRFTARPPALMPDDARFPGRDPRYADVRAEDLPRAESHADTLARLRPYWAEQIVPELDRGSSILVVSHKNTLRALVTLIEGRAETEVGSMRIPTGVPLVFVPDEAAPKRWQRVRDR